MSSSSRLTRLGAAALLAALALALALFAWRGWYSRYLTDDFCTAAQIRDWGFAKTMRFHRESWSGRFSYFPVKAALETIGPVTARITPGALIALLAAAAGWTIRRLTGSSRLLSAVGGLAIAFAAVASSPSLDNVGGALYWESGAITYTLALILLTLWTGLFANSTRTAAVAGGLLMLVAGGLNETSLAAHGAIAGGALLLALAMRARAQAWVAGCGLAGTLMALAIMATAPGNTLRLREQTSPISPVDGLGRMIEYANGFLGSYFFLSLATVLVPAGAAAVLGTRVRPRTALACAAIAIGAYVVSFLPVAWLLRDPPPERTFDVPNFLLIAATFAAALAVRRIPAAGVLLLALTVVPLWAVRTRLREIPLARYHAQRMDALDRTLRAQRGKEVVVHAPWLLRQGVAGTDPTHYANGCMSHYYRLTSLTVLP